MHLVKLDLNCSSFPGHITTLYRGGGEDSDRDKKHGASRVIVATACIYKSS